MFRRSGSRLSVSGRFFRKCVIYASEFCTALMTLPNAFAVPGGEFTVVRDDAPIAIVQ